MKTLLTCLLAVLLLVAPACGFDVKLEMGTVALKANVTIEEWAQANVLKALDELISGDEPEDPVPNKTEVVQPQ